MEKKIKVLQRLEDSVAVKQEIIKDSNIIELICEITADIIKSLRCGGKVILAGNGGSYSDSIHIAGEFVSKFMFDREPLAAVALGSNNAIVTAIGNDYAYEDIFCREFISIAKSQDVLICISTSGNSPNILKLAKLADTKGIKTYGLTGESGGKLCEIVTCLKVPSSITARIQEAHITIGHIICELVEGEIFKK